MIMASEEYRRGWREAQLLASRIIASSRSAREAMRRLGRLKRRLLVGSRFH